jgi:hypothetical protein
MNTFREHCKQQVVRFAGASGWPDPAQYPEAVRDLVDTVERVSKGDRDFAARLVRTCKETSRFCPTVHDIITVAGELHAVERKGPQYGFTGCQACDHSGWQIVKRGEYDVAIPCACRKHVPVPAVPGIFDPKTITG